jgi:hypothetical protein
MKRKTVYLDGTPLGVAQAWHQVSALLGHIRLRLGVQDHGNEDQVDSTSSFKAKVWGMGDLSQTHPTTPDSCPRCLRSEHLSGERVLRTWD